MNEKSENRQKWKISLKEMKKVKNYKKVKKYKNVIDGHRHQIHDNHRKK